MRCARSTAFALPAVLLAAIRFALPPLPLGAPARPALVAGLFAVAALYLWFKQAFGLAGEADFVARGLIERTIITQALFAAGWLLGAGIVRLPRIEPDLARLAGTMLTVARGGAAGLVRHGPPQSASGPSNGSGRCRSST